MGRGIDNYFLILELDFMNIETDEEVINSRIKEKVKFWNANADKGRMQQKYRQYKSQVINISKVMTTESLRKHEADEAKAFVQNILKEELKFFGGRKEIEEPAAKAIMEKCGLWEEMFTRLTKIKVGTVSREDGTKISDPNPQPKQTAKFKKYEADLAVVQKNNLYDFLANDARVDIIGLQTLDGEELLKGYAIPLKEKVKNDRTEEGTSVRTLCAACEEVFGSQSTSLRRYYDEYLIWKKKAEVINRMNSYSGIGKTLGDQQQRLFIDELTQILRDREQAVKIFHQICDYKSIKTSGSSAGKELSENILACGRCYAMVDISHGEKKCSSCGTDLYTKCPKCQKNVPMSLKACGHCGFILEDIQKVELLCKTAKYSIDSMYFDKARVHLAKAEQLLKGYNKIISLKDELEKKEKSFSKEIEQLNLLVSRKEFYKADIVLRELQRKAPAAKIPNDVLIESSVKEAEGLYKAAVSEKIEAKLIRICSQIASICGDYPGIEALLIKYRPKPVRNIRINCDSKICENTVTWDASLSEGEVSYKIMRRENNAAASAVDPAAQDLGVVGITQFVDTNLKAGVNYYYSIYAVRAGVLSDPLHANAVNLSEVCILQKEEGDGVVRVEWEPLEKNAKIKVFRCENRIPDRVGEGKEIPVNNNYFYDDTVENDKKYGYLVNVVYYVGGEEFTTSGITVLLQPSSFPDPVDDLQVSFLEDDLFEAKWTYKGKGKVLLFYTDKRIALKYGDITNIKKVEEILKPVDTVSYALGTCRFRMNSNKKYAIVPVTKNNNTAIIGEPGIAARSEKIEVGKVVLVNNQLRIDVKWPDDAVSVLAIYGNDGYAEGIEDRKQKTVRIFSKNMYISETGLYLKNIEKKDYYITLYSAYKINGETIYSEGTQLSFMNSPKADIQYSVRIKRLLNKQVEIEFKSSTPTFYLPSIDLVVKQGGVPVYNTSGTVIEHIDEQMVKGSCKAIISSASLPRNSFIKAFFSDADVNDEINLRPVYGTEFKVS